MLVDFKVIPHKKQRYETVGDWWWKGNTLNIRVSKLSNPKYELLVFHHELTEALLCKEAGVTTVMVDQWDMKYESHRELKTELPCGCDIQEEPGNDPHCPCFKQHQVATVCERIMAAALGVEWDEYDEEVESL